MSAITRGYTTAHIPDRNLSPPRRVPRQPHIRARWPTSPSRSEFGKAWDGQQINMMYITVVYTSIKNDHCDPLCVCVYIPSGKLTFFYGKSLFLMVNPLFLWQCSIAKD